MTTQELKHEIVDKVLTDLKQGAIPWKKPYIAGNPNVSHNGKTGNRYRGINCLLVAMAGGAYKDPRWYTFLQAKELNAHVRKGEKGTTIYRYVYEKELVARDEHGNPKKDEHGKSIKAIQQLDKPYLVRHTIFNAQQIEGLAAYEKKEVTLTELTKEADALIKGMGVPIHNDQDDRAYYSRTSDSIHLPDPSQYPDKHEYYATLLHEVSHATGHESRLNRDIGEFGSEKYAREELRAELGAFFVGTELGIRYNDKTIENGAAYINSWITALEKNPNEIFKATADAQKICDFVMDRDKEKLIAQAHKTSTTDKEKHSMSISL